METVTHPYLDKYMLHSPNPGDTGFATGESITASIMVQTRRGRWVMVYA